MDLKLIQIRHAANVANTTTYYVQSSVTDPGPIQDTGVFLVAIIDTADSTQDSFERVCTVVDIADFPNSRVDAVNQGLSLYRTSDVTLTYTDLVTANDEATKLKEDVDKLVTEWNTYYNEFYTTGDIITIPLTDVAALTALINTYTAAVTATATASSENTTAQAAQKSAQDAVSAADAEFNDAEEIFYAVNDLTSKITPLEAGIDDLKTLTTTVGDGPPSGFASVEYEGTNFLRELNRFMYWVKTTVTDIQAELDKTTPDTNIIQTKLNLLWNISSGTGAYIDFINSSYSPTTLDNTNSNIKTTGLPDALTAKDITVDTTVVGTHYETARSNLASSRVALTDAVITAKEKEAAYIKAQEDEALALKAVTDVYPAFDPSNPVPPT